DDPNGLHIGEGKGSVGSYILTDGTLSATPQIIAASGDGTLTQSGGVNTSASIAIATNPDSVGKYDLNGGGLVLDSGATQQKPAAAISIGGSGKGSFNLGDTNHTGAVY